jgi:hypothetical protein
VNDPHYGPWLDLRCLRPVGVGTRWSWVGSPRRFARGERVEREAVVGAERGPTRVRSHWRFRNRGAEYVSGSGLKKMSGSAKRRCDRALRGPPAAAGRCGRVEQQVAGGCGGARVGQLGAHGQE